MTSEVMEVQVLLLCVYSHGLQSFFLLPIYFLNAGGHSAPGVGPNHA